jgi:radical SAM superfamily enzyme YgiQ (UPF0313 family)
MRKFFPSQETGERELYRYGSGRFKLDLFFPNNYSAALGSLGFQSVYHFFNSQADFSVNRFYFEKNRPSETVSGEILALSISFENDIFNFVKALLCWGIEPLAEKRTGPLIIAGGVLTSINPRPLAPFVDLIIVGDGEIAVPRFAEIYGQYYLARKSGLLNAFSGETGFWVPTLRPFSEVESLTAPRPYPLHSVIISTGSHFRETFLVEVGRGCLRKCKFCVSSYIHHYEYHPSEKIISTIIDKVPPPTTVGLIGSALSDYPELLTLLQKLVERGYRLALSSLRPDILTPQLVEIIASGGVKTVTIAPEAGSLGLRKFIGKGMSDRVILKAVETVFRAGIPKVKLYFIIGLPGETQEDIEAIIGLIRKISAIFSMQGLEISVNPLIPKFHTPFSSASYAYENYIKKTRAHLKAELPLLKFSPSNSAFETTQYLIARGDESTGHAILKAVLHKTSLKSALSSNYKK